MDDDVPLTLGPYRTAYRLSRYPSFWFPSTIVVSRGEDEWQVAGKLTGALGSRVPEGALTAECGRVLTADEAAHLERLIDRLGFFSMPVEDDRHGLDGETWVLEAVEAERHHAIRRWSPEDVALVAFGEYLGALSGLPVERSRRKLTPKQVAELARARAESDRQRAEEERLRAEAVARSNERVRGLLPELLHRGLTCPHCGVRTREIRFVRGRPGMKSYLVCRLCGRSFGPD